MGKKSTKSQSKKSTREARAQQKIAKLQEELRRIQDQRMQIMRRGEEDVEKARMTAARRLSAATARLERKAAALARLEDLDRDNRRKNAASVTSAAAPVMSPGDVADRLASLESNADVIGAGDDIASSPSTNGLTSSQPSDTVLPESDGTHS